MKNIISSIALLFVISTSFAQTSKDLANDKDFLMIIKVTNDVLNEMGDISGKNEAEFKILKKALESNKGFSTSSSKLLATYPNLGEKDINFFTEVQDILSVNPDEDLLVCIERSRAFAWFNGIVLGIPFGRGHVSVAVWYAALTEGCVQIYLATPE